MTALLVKLALYVAAVGAAGLALAAWAILPSAGAARGVLKIAAALALAAAVAAGARFGLDAVALAGGWSSILDPPYLAWTWRAHAPFLALLLAGAAVLCAGAALGQRPLAALGGLILLASFTATGHVAGEEGAAWLRLALGAHLLGIAVWLATPALLWPRRAIDDAALRARVKAFSRIAVGLIPLALAAGGALAVALVGDLSRLTGSGYGRMILVKIAAATGAFSLGAVNKLWVTAQLEQNVPRGRALLRLTLGADTLLFTTALVAVATATTVLTPDA